MLIYLVDPTFIYFFFFQRNRETGRRNNQISVENHQVELAFVIVVVIIIGFPVFGSFSGLHLYCTSREYSSW